MKALTICQPYAELIARGEKRVENRTWETKYRGKLAIHAGKSKAWLATARPFIAPHGLPFGAVVAVVSLIDCVSYDDVGKGIHRAKYPWLGEHEHASGPWCWILEAPQRIHPIYWKGAQGLWNLDLSL